MKLSFSAFTFVYGAIFSKPDGDVILAGCVEGRKLLPTLSCDSTLVSAQNSVQNVWYVRRFFAADAAREIMNFRFARPLEGAEEH